MQREFPRETGHEASTGPGEIIQQKLIFEEKGGRSLAEVVGCFAPVIHRLPRTPLEPSGDVEKFGNLFLLGIFRGHFSDTSLPQSRLPILLASQTTPLRHRAGWRVGGPGKRQAIVAGGTTTGTAAESTSDPVAQSHATGELHVFDLLFLRGKALMGTPLSFRHEQLQLLLGRRPVPGVVATEGVRHHGRQLFTQVMRRGLEGIMAKRLDGPYLPGKRSPHWLKIKPSNSPLESTQLSKWTTTKLKGPAAADWL